MSGRHVKHHLVICICKQCIYVHIMLNRFQLIDLDANIIMTETEFMFTST